jgi:hypothetical protein
MSFLTQNSAVGIALEDRQATVTATTPGWFVRLLPSLTDGAFLMPIFFLFLKMEGASRLLEGDTGWHIRTGEWILANGRVPDRDIFSFTKYGEPWFAWEWLWDVIFAWLHMQWGMAAVVLGSLFVICLSFALLFRLARRKCDNVLLAFGITWVAMAASSIHWWARPHAFTFLFTVIFYSILERVRDGKTRLLLWLPLITVVWTNLHGGFFVGILFLAAYGGGEVAAALLAANAQQRLSALKRAAPYGLAALGCLAASLVNPYFYKLHVHVFRYLTDEYHFRVISEFQSVSFQNPGAVYFEVLIVLGIAAVVWHIARGRFGYALLLGGWLHLALASARNIPLYAIAAAPVVAAALAEMLAGLQGAGVAGWCKRMARSFYHAAADFNGVDKLPRLHVASLLGSVVVILLVSAPGDSKLLSPEYDIKRYPAEAMAVLVGGPPARIFTDDEWGDYLIYRSYPHGRVFIDGRSDFYGAEFGNRYLETMNVKYDWEASLSRHAIDTVLLPVGASLAGVLKESPRWRPVYDDGVAIVFRSKSWISRFGAANSSTVSNGGRLRDRAVTSASDYSDRAVTRLQLQPAKENS